MSFARTAPLRRPVSQKHKFRLLCNFFAIEDSFPSSARRKWAAVRPICRFSGLHPRFDASWQFAIAKKLQFWAYFCFLGTRIGLMLVPWAGWPGRGAFVDDFGQRCGRGRLGSAVRGCLWWRNVGGWMPWTTRRREWSGPGVTPLVALETLRVGVWSGAAGRHKKCLRLLASVREGKSICWAACWRFALLLVSGFFACRIRGRSYPRSIAAPSVLRYDDKNYFKRALKCICVQNKQEKAPSILKKGRIHGFSHLC